MLSSKLRNHHSACSCLHLLKVFVIWLSLVMTLTEASVEHYRVKRIVGGKFAKPPPPDDPVVFTRAFARDARVEGYRNSRTGIYSFLGIYYAEPPTGENRYARPIFKRLSGDVNATQHGPPCIQPDQRNPNRIIGDENCLLLNVYTPQMPDETTGLPVYLWIHPGGFRFGSASQYDATPMAQQGVIVVSPNYRLGSLGIMGDGTKEFDGNLAIFDIAAALRWVNDYISYFGGDPKQIKAIGHGSGAASAMYLSMSRSARNAGEVSGVVAMSGTALSQYATDKEPVQSVEEIAKINDCPTSNELEIVQCLRKKPAEDIIKNDGQVQTERLAGRAMVKGISGSVGFQPHIEDKDDARSLPSLIVGEPEVQLKSGDFEPVPLLTGVTKHETANAVTVDTINKVFGSAEKFLNSLTDALMGLTGFLRIDQATGDILKPDLPGLTGALTPAIGDLWKIPSTFNVDQILSKVIESTTDVLFNLPAVLTSQVWSKIAPSFVYSFEYSGSAPKGINFLRGLPIVMDEANSKPEVVAHGDELAYLFDANDVFGNPLINASLSGAEDLKVRKNFIGMLVKFATSFKENSTGRGNVDSLFKGKSGDGTPFIKVGSDIETGSDFRFCELSVLGAALTPLASTSCKGLGSILNPLTNVIGGGLGGLTGTLGGKGDKTGSNILSPTNIGNSVGGLGGITGNTGLLGGGGGRGGLFG